MDISRLKKRMAVIAAEGRRMGFVRRMAWPDRLQLTSLSAAHGYDHVIPLSWVSAVDKYVYLNRSSAYVAAHWENLAPKPVAAKVPPPAGPEAPDLAAPRSKAA